MSFGNDILAKQFEEFQKFQNLKGNQEAATPLGCCRQPFITNFMQYQVPKDVKIPKIKPYLGNTSPSMHLDMYIT